MTFKEYMVETMTGMGMFDSHANKVIEEYVKEESAEPMDGRWDQDVSNFPENLKYVVWLGVKMFADGWLERNLPNAWFRPLFKYTQDGARRTIGDVKKELINLKHNHTVVYVTSGELLVVDKEQTIQLGSTVETANGNKYTVSDIDMDGRVYVR